MPVATCGPYSIGHPQPLLHLLPLPLYCLLSTVNKNKPWALKNIFNLPFNHWNHNIPLWFSVAATPVLIRITLQQEFPPPPHYASNSSSPRPLCFQLQQRHAITQVLTSSFSHFSPHSSVQRPAEFSSHNVYSNNTSLFISKGTPP